MTDTAAIRLLARAVLDGEAPLDVLRDWVEEHDWQPPPSLLEAILRDGRIFLDRRARSTPEWAHAACNTALRRHPYPPRVRGWASRRPRPLAACWFYRPLLFLLECGDWEENR